MISNLFLATIIFLDFPTGSGSRFTECSTDFISWTAFRDANYVYSTCADGEVINLPTEPTREALSIDEIIISDGADSIERQGCGLVSDRTVGGSREIVLACGVQVFHNGFGTGQEAPRG